MTSRDSTTQTVVPPPLQQGMELVSCTQNGQVDLNLSKETVPEVLVHTYQAAVAGHPCDLSADTLCQLRAQADQSDYGDLVRLILAEVFKRTGRLSEAQALLEAILSHGEHAYVLTELAVMATQQHQFDRATEYHGRALTAQPDNLWMQGNHAVALVQSGRIEEGVQRLKAIAGRAETGQVLYSKYLWNLHYAPEGIRQTVYEAHRKWASRFGTVEPITTTYANDVTVDRRLRIGYVSADFKSHCVATTFENLLDGRSPQRMEVFGYGSVTRPDQTTERLMTKFDCYRDIARMRDREVAERIRQDGIDILVFLGGLTSGNRVGVALLKPAPVQVDYGAIATYGLEQMDYRITDEVLDPAGTEAFYTERLVRLPQGYVSYRAPESAGAVAPLPALTNGYITFGSFSNHCKINKTVIALWARLLNAVPSARLLLKTQGATYSVWTDWLYREFERHAVPAHRITLLGWMDLAEHFSVYNRVDIALDTNPYNGCLTTLEGLWMGVPVITLAGATYTACVGRTILSRINMESCVASTPDGYVAKAKALAQQLESLTKIRRCLRPRMMQSSLCDAGAYARQYEAALYGMWKQWCARNRT